MTDRTVLLLAAMLLVMCTITVGCGHSQTKTALKPQTAAPQVNVSSVGAQIVDISPSPDESIVRLMLQKPVTGNPPHYEVALFDLNRRVVVGKPCTVSSPADMAWSPDSRRMAVAERGAGAWIINRDGSAKQAALSVPVSGVKWVSDTKFVGNIGSDSKYLLEYDVSRGLQRKTRLSHPGNPWFIVRGRPCQANHEDTRNLGCVMRVVDAETDRQMFTVRLHEYASWYEESDQLDVSPDGNYFYIRLFYSASTVDVLARAQDAETVFKRPWEAIMWQADSNISGLVWLPTSRSDTGHPQALFPDGPPQGPPMLLDLVTGSRTELTWDTEGLQRKYPIHTPLGPDYAWGRFLVVSERGLELYNSSAEPTTLLLRHKVVE